MSGKSINKIALSALVFLILLSISYADFQAIGPERIDGCGCSLVKQELIVKNNGYEISLYTLETNNDWVNYVPNQFTLRPGDEQKIEVFIKPSCSAKGEFTIITKIVENTGITKNIEQKLGLENCQNMEISIKDILKQSCPCTPVLFPLQVKNTGQSFEIYHISSELNYVFSDKNALMLDAGQTETANIVVSAPCELYGKQPIPINVEAEYSGINSITTFIYDILACYNYDIQAGIYSPYKNTTFYTFTQSKDLKYEICRESKNIIPILINNNENSTNTFNLKIEGPDWVSLDRKSIELNKNNKGIVNIIASPNSNAEGSFSIKFTSTSKLGEISKSLDLTATIGKCGDFSIDLPSTDRTCCEPYSYPVTITNDGEIEETFQLGVFGPEWAKLSEKNVKIKPTQNKTINLEISPDCTKLGNNEITISAELNKINSISKKEKKINIELMRPNTCYDLDLENRASFFGSKNINIDYGNNSFQMFIKGKGYRKAIYEVKVDGPSWVFTNLTTIELDYGQEKYININAWPDQNTEPGVYPISISLTPKGTDTAIAFELEISLAKKSIVMDYIQTYLAYIIIAILLLAFIIGYLIYSKKEKNTPIQETVQEQQTVQEKPIKKKTRKKPSYQLKFDYEEPKYQTEKHSSMFKILIIFLIILFIIFALLVAYFTGYIPGKSTLNETNTTEIIEQPEINLPKENISEENTLPEETLEEGVNYYSWEKNNVYTIDLTIKANDMDKDTLEFTSSTPEHITVEISEDGIATLIPDENWTGKDTIQFFVTDGKSEPVASPVITLEVKELATGSGIITFIKNYSLYFVFGILILAALILVMHFSEKKK